jgi:hypothetical protein
MATSQDFANWVCGNESDPEFLMYALICSREHLRSSATGTTHKTIYTKRTWVFRKAGCVSARVGTRRADAA